MRLIYRREGRHPFKERPRSCQFPKAHTEFRLPSNHTRAFTARTAPLSTSQPEHRVERAPSAEVSHSCGASARTTARAGALSACKRGPRSPSASASEGNEGPGAEGKTSALPAVGPSDRALRGGPQPTGLRKEEAGPASGDCFSFKATGALTTENCLATREHCGSLRPGPTDQAWRAQAQPEVLAARLWAELSPGERPGPGTAPLLPNPAQTGPRALL